MHSELQIEVLGLAEAAHSVTDRQFAEVALQLRNQAKTRIANGPL